MHKRSVFQISGIAGDPYSSTLALGYEQARVAQIKNDRYRQLLFVIAGTGVTSACGIYRL